MILLNKDFICVHFSQKKDPLDKSPDLLDPGCDLRSFHPLVRLLGIGFLHQAGWQDDCPL
jgi:hypothetical protein